MQWSACHHDSEIRVSRGFVSRLSLSDCETCLQNWPPMVFSGILVFSTLCVCEWERKSMSRFMIWMMRMRLWRRIWCLLIYACQTYMLCKRLVIIIKKLVNALFSIIFHWWGKEGYRSTLCTFLSSLRVCTSASAMRLTQRLFSIAGVPKRLKDDNDSQDVGQPTVTADLPVLKRR